ncbi:MAG: transketolase [Acidimicrobiaceae bacterium]|nr:transketolase [Acidimicrobiaceae bacterium]MBO0747985.1 transketolase [Acidimicrobiaceae bacterium]
MPADTTVEDGPVTLERGRPISIDDLEKKADWIRLRTIDLIDSAGLGHYSSTFSCAELISVLYYHTMRLRPSQPDWPDRDRFLLGKGHVATGVWPVLVDLGYFPESWLEQFGKIGSRINDHPNMKLAPGIDFSSGALGHNTSVGVGMALAGKLRGQDYRVFEITGDGELQEGTVWEGIMAAGHYKLGNMILIADANGFSGAGPTSGAMNIEPLPARFESFGWEAIEVDGHDVKALVDLFDSLPENGDRPIAVVARTKKGHGLAMTEEAPQAWHLGLMTPEQREAAKAEIGARLK